MPIFITQGRFTQDAIKGMMAKPEDREPALRQLAEKSGGKLLAYYMTFGEYDFLIISEGPLEDAATPLIVAAAGGGVVIDTGSHWLRPLRVWFGEVGEVVAALGHPHAAMEGESLCRALLRFESGMIASFDAMLATGAIAPQPLFTITGTRGELTVEGSGWVKRFDGREPRGTKVGEQGGYLRSYEGELADFASAVRRGTTPAAPAAYAVGELRLALAMYRSAETGRWEKV